MVRAAQTLRYQRRVFICPPWPKIYATDTERKQTPEVAERTNQMMIATYRDCGYEPVKVPRADVETRARFLREALTA